MKYIFHVGRNDNLAIAELISVYGERSVKAVSGSYVVVESDDDLSQSTVDRLGGTISLYKVISEGNEFIVDSFFDLIVSRYESSKGSKMSIAVESNYLPPNYIDQMLKKLKVFVKNVGYSFRYIAKVSTAALLGSGFLKGKVLSYKILNLEDKIFLAELVGLQNIDSYTKRDRSKPYRDAKLGMLPPKLSQMMLNLAGESNVVYDPFCGTGTILMEALLVGRKIVGSDIEVRNIEGASKNLYWTKSVYNLEGAEERLFVRDATKIGAKDLENVDVIVTEGYLGVPKYGNEPRAFLEAELAQLEELYFKFLSSVAKFASKPVVLVLCLPVFATGSDNLYMENLVEKVVKLGYSVSALIPNGNNLHLKAKDTVLYKRESQKVYRQIIKLQLTP